MNLKTRLWYNQHHQTRPKKKHFFRRCNATNTIGKPHNFIYPFARPSSWLAIRAPWKSQTQRTCWNWHKSGRNESLSSWWFQPTWKIWVKLDHFRRVRGENEKYLKPLPSLCWRCGKSLMWNRLVDIKHFKPGTTKEASPPKKRPRQLLWENNML